MNNSRSTSSLSRVVLVALCSLALSSAWADNSNDKANLASTPCVNMIDCLSAGYGTSLRNLLFQPTYQQANSMAAGSLLRTIFSAHAKSALATTSNTSKSIMVLISNKGNTADQFLASTPEIFAPGIVLAPAGSAANIPFISASAFANVNQKPNDADVQTAMNSLDFDSVIAPMAYHKVNATNSTDDKNKVDQQYVANAFIQYVTGLNNPMRASDFSSVKLPSDGSYSSVTSYLATLQKNPDVRNYLTALRTYTAQLSVGISNFYYLYNERSPITDPTVLAQAVAAVAPPAGSTLAPLPAGPLSPLQFEHFLATRRVNDANWFTAMQNALPSTLLRETLYQLAEIPPMLFQLHLDLERILATLSSTQLIAANNTSQMLQVQRDKVDAIIQSPTSSTSAASQVESQASQQNQSAQILAAKQALQAASRN